MKKDEKVQYLESALAWLRNETLKLSKQFEYKSKKNIEMQWKVEEVENSKDMYK
jgi:hypothetical protein